MYLLPVSNLGLATSEQTVWVQEVNKDTVRKKINNRSNSFIIRHGFASPSYKHCWGQEGVIKFHLPFCYLSAPFHSEEAEGCTCLALEHHLGKCPSEALIICVLSRGVPGEVVLYYPAFTYESVEVTWMPDAELLTQMLTMVFDLARGRGFLQQQEWHDHGCLQSYLF